MNSKGNAGGEKYQCILTDAAERKVKDILPNRFEEDLIQYFKRSKYSLNQSLGKLTKGDMHHLSLMFEISPRLADAYKLKNYFMTVLQADPDDAPKLLADQLLLAEDYNLKEFKPCMTAYRNWSAEILNSFRFPWSNGFTEGCNNKTKVLKRLCFGVRNFDRFRNRILHCSS